MNKNTKQKPTGFDASRWFGLMLLALCLFSSGAAQSNSPVWYAGQQTLYQIDPADQRVLQTLRAGDVNKLAADASGGVWLNGGSHIAYYGTPGSTPRTWRTDVFGLGPARQLQVDPYDASVWLGDGTRVVHLSANGGIIATIAVATNAEDIALSLDASVWILETDGPLRHYDRLGAPLGSLAIPDSMRGSATRFAIDSIRQKIWLWNAAQLVQLDLNTGAQQRSFALSAGSIATVLDRRTGTLWTMSKAALTAYSATGFPQETALNALGITNPFALASDAGNDCLWIGHAAGLSRLDFTRPDATTLIAATPALQIGSAPFAPRPALNLLAPASHRIAASANTAFVLGVDTLCYGNACPLSDDELKNTRIEAMLGQQSVGEQFVFDAGNRSFRYAAVLPASGRISLSAQAFDRFGHGSNIVDETFELGLGADLAPSNTNALAVTHAAPTVSITTPLNNAAINGPATVAITASATATGATVSKVAFYSGTTLLGTVTTSPYTYNWANVAVGSYTLTAKVTDSLASTATSAAVKITVAHPAPTVSITAPANNASISGPTTVAIKASAATIGATISKVAFYNGTTLLGTATTSPYSYNWTNVAAGTYTLTAKATDSLGASATSTAVKITVSAHPAPTVSITSPVNNTSVAGLATIAITASTAASGATVSKVDFYNGTTLLGSATASPYTYNWTNVTAGVYTLTAKATDSLGAAATSTGIKLTVTHEPLTVSMTSPLDGDSVPAPSVTITADAAEIGGAVAKVQFYKGTTLLGTATSAPYRYTWTNAATGTYTLSAKATDSSGATATSDPVTITVTPKPPSVSITAPANNAIVQSPIAITVNAQPGANAVQSVEYWDGTDSLGTALAAPYSFTWTNAAPGNHSLTAQATDIKGIASALSSPVNITVPSPLPVTLTSSAIGTVLTEPASVSFAASASSPNGSISKVEFYNGSTLLATATVAPYTFSLPNLASGNYMVTAKATDSVGVSGISNPVFLAVDAIDSCNAVPSADAKAAAGNTTSLALNPFPFSFEANQGQAPAAVKFQARGIGYNIFLAEDKAVLALKDAHNPAQDGAALYLRFVNANPRPVQSGQEALPQKSHYLIGSDPAAWQRDIAHYAKVKTSDLYPGIDVVYYGKQGQLEYDLIVAPGADPRQIRFALDGASAIVHNDNGDLQLHTAAGLLIKHQPIAWQDIDGERRLVDASYDMLAANDIAIRVGDYDARYPLVIDPVLVYASTFGSTAGSQTLYATALDRCGNLFVAGAASAADFPVTPGALNPQYVPSLMGFVSKLNATGTALLYSTYIGSAQTVPLALALDSSGHAYVAGVLYPNDDYSNLDIGTPGSVQTAANFPATRGNHPLAFAAKLSTDGKALLYGSLLGGSKGELANSIAVDAAGNAYVAGSTSSNDFPVTPGAFQPTKAAAAGLTSAFASKLNPTGSTLVYSTYLGGSASDIGNAIAVDSAGNATVAGEAQSSDFPTTPGAFQTVKPSGPNASSGFVARLNPTGSALLFGTYLGASTTTSDLSGRVLNGMAIDAAGNTYLTGATKLGSAVPNFLYAKTFIPSYPGETIIYAYAAKLGSDGAGLSYFVRFGGADCLPGGVCYYADSVGQAIAVDRFGNAIVTGSTGATNFPLVSPLQPQTADAGKAFISKLTPAGDALVYSTYLSGDPGSSQNISEGLAMAVDAAGTATVVGSTNAADFPVTPGAYQSSLTGAFIAQLSDPKSSAVTLATSANVIVVGQSITLSAAVTGHNPGGNVSFRDRDRNPAPKTSPDPNNDPATTLANIALNGAATSSASLMLPGGFHSITAVYGGDGNNDPSTSLPVMVTVSDPITPPSVRFGIQDGWVFYVGSSPNDHYSGGLAVLASAANGNLLDKIEVFQNGLLIGTLAGIGKNSATYNVPIPALGIGSYLYTAQATDTYGHTSPLVTLRFNVNPSSGSPSVSLTAPANGATATSPILLTANATAATGASIVKVDFYQGATLLGSTANSPYSLSWNNAAPGTYALSAGVTDSSGASSFSSVNTINVILALPTVTISGASPGPGGGSATLSFTISAGGATVTAYTASCSAAGRPGVSASVGGNATSITLTGMTGGVAYTCSITAVNGSASGVPSVAVTVTPTTQPPAPPVITAATPGAGSATLNFSAPGNNGGAAVTAYGATCSAPGIPSVSASAGSAATSITLSGLIGGVPYQCAMTASNSAGVGAAGAPVTVTPNAPRLAATLTAPANNSNIAALTPVTISVVAQTSTGTIAKIELLDGTTLLSSYLPAGAAAVFTYNYPWNPGVGGHALSARVTDSTGATATSAILTVQALTAPSVTFSTTGNFFIAPAAIELVASVTAGNGATIGKVEFFNGASLLATLTAPPYLFRWTDVGSGSYTLRAKATDSQGISAGATATLTVLAAPGLAPDGAQDGSSVNDDHVTITGQVQTPLNSAVDVNGQVGVIAADGRFFINNVALKPGSNPLTLRLMTPDGATTVTSLTVNSTGPAPFRFDTSSNQGFAPLAVGITLAKQGDEGTATVTRIDLLCQDDGVVSTSFTTTDSASLAKCGYPDAGLYRIRVNVYGQAPDQAEQLLYSGTQNVNVVAVAYQDAMLRAVYRGMLARLKAGDVTGALNAVTAGMRDKFSTIFNGIGTNLPTMVDQVSVLTDGRFNDNFAEYLVVRNMAPDGPTGYPIQFIRGEDGIWRIDGM